MIYVTVGTHIKASFDRLLRSMDALAPGLGEPVFAQIGPTDYRPRNMEHAAFLPYAEAERRIREASLVVSHAGIGTTLLARRHGVRLVLVPRSAALGEHFNDHQTEIAERLRGRPGIRVVRDLAELEKAVRGLLAEPPPSLAAWGKGRDAIAAEIRSFLGVGPVAG